MDKPSLHRRIPLQFYHRTGWGIYKDWTEERVICADWVEHFVPPTMYEQNLTLVLSDHNDPPRSSSPVAMVRLPTFVEVERGDFDDTDVVILEGLDAEGEDSYDLLREHIGDFLEIAQIDFLYAWFEGERRV